MSFLEPKISVITVTYNSEKTIEDTIRSVCAQTYKNFEYIIIDGKSADQTLEIISQYEGLFDGKMKVVSEKDTGIYNAMNKGIRRATGDIVGLINSDDCYDKRAFEWIAQEYSKRQERLLVINGDAVRISIDGDPIFRYHYTQRSIENKAYMLHAAMFATKAVYDKIGFYDERYRLAADYDWQNRVHEDVEISYVLCPQVLSYMREGGASDSIKALPEWFKERSAIKIHYGIAPATQAYIGETMAAVRTILKAMLPPKIRPLAYKVLYGGGKGL